VTTFEIPLPAQAANGSEPIDALRLLFWLRVLAIGSQATIVAFVHFVLDIDLPLAPLAVTIGALTLWNALSFVRLRSDRKAGHSEVALHLLVDVVAFTSVIYLTGGPTNPFVSFYLVPISLAATSLPAAYAWLVGAACGAGYSLLWLRHVPLPSVHGRFGGDFDLHIAGMWVNFLVAAALIVLFVGRMAQLVRRRDRELAAMREAALRDQQIVELGTLAAGTAHELNTPLSTLALLVEELDDSSTDAEHKARLRLMMEEIGVINCRLNRIAGGVDAARSQGARSIGLTAFVRGLLEQWKTAHPEIDLAARFAPLAHDPQIVAEVTIEQAIRNVLDNAAHATLANGGNRVDVAVDCSATSLTIAVTDHGVGLDPEVRDEIGLKIISTKQRGLGIGLLLSRAALQRFGGRLQLASAAAGGVEAQIQLPLNELSTDAS
jgi:two-component system sensor histidine kinase RegB